MKKLNFVYWLTLVLATSAHATQDPLQFELGISLDNGDSLAVPANVEYDSNIVTQLSLGLSKQWQLDEEWRFDSAMSVSYAFTDVFAQSNSTMAAGSDLENIGIWADSALLYTGFSDSARPFLQLGVGKVYGDYDSADVSVSGWETGYRALAGFEFDLIGDSTLRIAVGEFSVGEIE